MSWRFHTWKYAGRAADFNGQRCTKYRCRVCGIEAEVFAGVRPPFQRRCSGKQVAPKSPVPKVTAAYLKALAKRRASA